MKKKKIVFVSLLVILLLLPCITAYAVYNPDFATNTHEDMSLIYYGYVQCQPSFNDGGQQAADGYIRYMRYNLFGYLVEDTGRMYTEHSIGPDDNNIYSRSEVFYDSILWNPYKTEFWYEFTWVPYGSGNWPY